MRATFVSTGNSRCPRHSSSTQATLLRPRPAPPGFLSGAEARSIDASAVQRTATVLSQHPVGYSTADAHQVVARGVQRRRAQPLQAEQAPLRVRPAAGGPRRPPAQRATCPLCTSRRVRLQGWSPHPAAPDKGQHAGLGDSAAGAGGPRPGRRCLPGPPAAGGAEPSPSRRIRFNTACGSPRLGQAEPVATASAGTSAPPCWPAAGGRAPCQGLHTWMRCARLNCMPRHSIALATCACMQLSSPAAWGAPPPQRDTAGPPGPHCGWHPASPPAAPTAHLLERSSAHGLPVHGILCGDAAAATRLVCIQAAGRGRARRCLLRCGRAGAVPCTGRQALAAAPGARSAWPPRQHTSRARSSDRGPAAARAGTGGCLGRQHAARRGSWQPGTGRPCWIARP